MLRDDTYTRAMASVSESAEAAERFIDRLDVFLDDNDQEELPLTEDDAKILMALLKDHTTLASLLHITLLKEEVG